MQSKIQRNKHIQHRTCEFCVKNIFYTCTINCHKKKTSWTHENPKTFNDEIFPAFLYENHIDSRGTNRFSAYVASQIFPSSLTGEQTENMSCTLKILLKMTNKKKTDRNTAVTSKIPFQNKTNGQIRWKTTFYVENPSKLPQKETNDQTRQKARRPKKREWSNPPNTDLTLKITLKIPFTNSRKTKCTVKPDTKLEFYVENPF